MRVGLGQGNLYGTCAGMFGRPHAGFKSGVGGHVAFLRRSKGENAEGERRSRTNRRVNVIRTESFNLGESLNEFVGQLIGIASTLWENRCHGISRPLRRSEERR